MRPRKGDRYVYTQGGRDEVFITITRSSESGWVDISCNTWAVAWTKRMPHGLNPEWERRDWGQPDVDAQQECWEVDRHGR